MRKHWLLAALVGVVCLLSAGAVAGFMALKNPAFAEVVSVDPVTETVSRPDRGCRDEQIRQRKAMQEASRNSAGTVIGGMAGGVVTHPPQPVQQEDGAYAKPGAHCQAANRVSAKIVAYDVRYRLHGKTAKVRMDHNPGPKLPVKNGKVVVTREVAKRAGPKV